MYVYKVARDDYLIYEYIFYAFFAITEECKNISIIY